jgi:hypothetical protein
MNIHLAADLITVINEGFDDRHMTFWYRDKNMYVHKPTTINMAVLQNGKVMSESLNVDRICTSLSCSF